ncbi:MAG: nucleotidyltransferase family protein [Burkholderiaceae bacterium]|nr:nucleotidyltransferase family protein [Burkholderiaceae bacterium]
MHAMVLAAGRGERMRPLTDTTPKPLLRVKGRPLIDWHLQAISNAGITQIVINLAHLGDQIRQHIGNGDRFGVKVRYSQEPVGALETGGGIAAAQPWIDDRGQHNPSPFLVVNADIFTDWPMAQALEIAGEWMRASTAASNSLQRPRCHLILVDNPSHHAQGDFGLAPAVHGQPARVTGRPEHGSLTFSGIGVYDPKLFASIAPGERAALAPLLHRAVAEGRCTGSHYRGLWCDVGTPERLAQLNQT